MSQHWSTIQESGAVWGMRIMFFIYRYIGRWAFKLCLYPVILYYYLFNRIARHASHQYLKQLWSYSSQSLPGNLHYQSFRHFLRFGESILDKLAAWTGAFSYQNVTFHHRKEFLSMIEQGNGALIIVSHLGNLEVCRALADISQNFRLNILVHTKHAENFNQLLSEINGDTYLNLLQVTETNPATAVMLAEKIENNEVVVIAGDRTPVNGGQQVIANFLGQPAPFPIGPYVLASILQCPVYLMFSVKGAQGYEIFLEPFAERIKLNRRQRMKDCQVFAQKFADRLSDYAQRYPLEWHNFYNFWKQEDKLREDN